ncbi:MAG: YajQ family cyclic di-GMP-binding protein [Acidimicrobiia bacterium]
MPSFDVVSQVDMQEVRNALDQAHREVANRFDFKGTDSTLDLAGHEIELHSNTEQKLKSLVQVLEEKLVRRNVPLKALGYGRITEAAKGTVRQTVTLNVGISDDKGREINKFLKTLNLKGVQSQVQGDQLRVSGKKKDDLQAAIAGLKGHDFGIPLQYVNLRD